MSSKKPPTPAEPKEPVANDDWAESLSQEALDSLVGYFDVLIRMEQEQQRKKRSEDNE
jgi:hypothetical protein